MSRDLDGFVEKPSVCAWEAGYHRARLRPSSLKKWSMTKCSVLLGQMGYPGACRLAQRDVQRLSRWVSRHESHH